MDRVAAEIDARNAQALAKRRADRQPILDALKLCGVTETDPFKIRFTAESKCDRTAQCVIETILQHLETGGYLDQNRAEFAMILECPAGLPYWDRILSQYVNALGAMERDALAIALSGIARKAQIPDIIDVVRDSRNGESRLLFFRRLLRSGGEEGLAVVESYVGDPQLGQQAEILLAERRRRAARKSS